MNVEGSKEVLIKTYENRYCNKTKQNITKLRNYNHVKAL